ncbi:hypothetical protein P7K49_018823 [Saguinus oedipus]|uniref:Immunoglobulin V-set domain-containing protein n=1 Tax=Saguinus oedipus TaxID=9490 RepID=A0ABQ9V6X4_SAGOE|nr:hypothetical protein P7K49_018823 [Saguinus oedipus]
MPGKGLEWMGMIDPGDSDTRYSPSFQGHITTSADKSTSTAYLQWSSLKATDTAMYYCVRDTVTGKFPGVGETQDANTAVSSGVAVSTSAAAQQYSTQNALPAIAEATCHNRETPPIQRLTISRDNTQFMLYMQMSSLRTKNTAADNRAGDMSPGHPRGPTEWSGAGADPSASRHIFHTGSRCRRCGKRAGDAWSDQRWRQNSPFSPEPMSSRLTPTSGRTGSWERAAVTVSSFYDVTRNRHGMVSVGGAKATVTSTIAPNTTFPKTPQKSGQGPTAEPARCLVWGFPEQQLTTLAEKFQELKEAAEMPKDKAGENRDLESRFPMIWA